jgi:hypothetical protein
MRTLISHKCVPLILRSGPRLRQITPKKDDEYLNYGVYTLQLSIRGTLPDGVTPVTVKVRARARARVCVRAGTRARAHRAVDVRGRLRAGCAPAVRRLHIAVQSESVTVTHVPAPLTSIPHNLPRCQTRGGANDGTRPRVPTRAHDCTRARTHARTPTHTHPHTFLPVILPPAMQ